MLAYIISALGVVDVLIPHHVRGMVGVGHVVHVGPQAISKIVHFAISLRKSLIARNHLGNSESSNKRRDGSQRGKEKSEDLHIETSVSS